MGLAGLRHGRSEGLVDSSNTQTIFYPQLAGIAGVAHPAGSSVSAEAIAASQSCCHASWDFDSADLHLWHLPSSGVAEAEVSCFHCHAPDGDEAATTVSVMTPASGFPCNPCPANFVCFAGFMGRIFSCRDQCQCVGTSAARHVLKDKHPGVSHSPMPFWPVSFVLCRSILSRPQSQSSTLFCSDKASQDWWPCESHGPALPNQEFGQLISCAKLFQRSTMQPVSQLQLQLLSSPAVITWRNVLEIP